MTVSARLKGFRVSPTKARLVADQVRGKGVDEALKILDLSPKRFSNTLGKLVRSAVANAEQKNERDKAGIDLDNLVVATITVDQGPNNWRIRPRAQGRANWINHRTSHVRIVLSEE